LYDSLLDELEDDVVSNPQEVEELTEKVVDAEEADAELLVEDADVTGIAEADKKFNGCHGVIVAIKNAHFMRMCALSCMLKLKNSFT